MMIKRGIWCPTENCVEPPVYGDSLLKKYKRKSNNLPTEKLYNTPRSDRSSVEEKKVKDCKNASWRKSKPQGTSICFDPNSVMRDASITKKMHKCLQNLDKGKRAKDLCTLKPTPSVSTWMPRGAYCSRNVIPRDKKKMYYNVMWDPRVCHGPTSVNFAEHQKEKCQRELDLNRWLDFRSTTRARVRKRKEGGGYLDKRSNPTGQILYPSVHAYKEPLTYQSFTQFLEDTSERPKYVDKAQCMARLEDINEEELHRKGITVWEGTGVQTQTDIEPCKLDMENRIVDTMVEKIPQQALLECAEECELEVLKGERRRYEMVFLFRKWQQKKEDQWNEWLYAWNEIRMNAIMEENQDFEEKMERMYIIGFAKNTIDFCCSETCRAMKVDGFMNKEGVPYEEMEEIEKTLDLKGSFKKKFHGSTKMSEKVLDSAVTQAVVQRFASHMNDVFGWPHGRWLMRTGRHDSVAYDVELQKYLEGRWMERREGPMESRAIHSIRTDFGLADLFQKNFQKQSSHINRMYNIFDIRKLEKEWKRQVEPKASHDTNTPPPTPNESVIRSTHKMGSNYEIGEAQESFAVIFKRESGSLDGKVNKSSSDENMKSPKKS